MAESDTSDNPGTYLEHYDRDTGETQTIGVLDDRNGTVPIDLRPETFAEFASRPAEEAATAILTAAVSPDEVDILPTGELYLSHARYRTRLVQAFGPMGWGMRPLGEHMFDAADGTLYREWGLVVSGRLAAVAVGSASYHETNDRMSYADAAEAVKSNALSRCCKDLGIALELWDHRWIEVFKRDFCVKVWRKSTGGKRDGQQGSYQWRRKDADPFWDEPKPETNAPDKGKPADQPTQTARPVAQGPATGTPVNQGPAKTGPVSGGTPATKTGPVDDGGVLKYPAALVVAAEFIKRSAPDAAKPWSLWAVKLEGVAVNFETLSESMFKTAVAHRDGRIPVYLSARIKKDSKNKDHYDIVTIEPAL